MLGAQMMIDVIGAHLLHDVDILHHLLVVTLNLCNTVTRA
jgi:hypothetical protein